MKQVSEARENVVPSTDNLVLDSKLERLRSDIFRLLIHVPRADILRFVRRLVWNIMERENLHPERILDEEDRCSSS